MPYADTKESPMHPEKLLAGIAMAAMLACLAVAAVGRILGKGFEARLLPNPFESGVFECF